MSARLRTNTVVVTQRAGASHSHAWLCLLLAALGQLACSEGDDGVNVGEVSHVDDADEAEESSRDAGADDPNDEHSNAEAPDGGDALTDTDEQAAESDADDSTDADDPATDGEPTATDEAPDDEPAPSLDGGSPDAPATDETGSPLWIYYATPTRAVVNVNDPSQRVTDLYGQVDTASSAAPWSADGKWLARENGDTLELYDLADGSLALEARVDGLSNVLRWAGPDTVLVSALELGVGSRVVAVTTTGDVTEILPPLSEQGLASYSTSPDGRTFLYSLGGAADFPFYQLGLPDPDEPTLVATHADAPALSFIWSNDSRWVAFGVPSSQGGMYLWSVASGEAPERVSPEGTSYTPLHSFSPGGNAYIGYVGAADGSALVLTSLEESSVDSEELSRAADQSPASWSPDGSFLTYSSGGSGWLHSVEPDGRAGDRVEIPTYDYGCALGWANSTEFLYEACADDDDDELRWASAGEPQAASVVPIEPLGTLGFAGPCLVQWSDAGHFEVGVLSRMLSLDSVNSPVTSVERVTLHPQGAGFAWVVNETSFYWQALEACVPVGRPRLIDVGEPISQLEFVPRP